MQHGKEPMEVGIVQDLLVMHHSTDVRYARSVAKKDYYAINLYVLGD
jgi:hypothetical protein